MNWEEEVSTQYGFQKIRFALGEEMVAYGKERYKASQGGRQRRVTEAMDLNILKRNMRS